MGYDQISQLATDPGSAMRAERGRVLLENVTSFGDLIDKVNSGWGFSKTRLSEKFGFTDYKNQLQEGEQPVAVLKPDNKLLFFSAQARPVIEDGDEVISFVAPDCPEDIKKQREQSKKQNDKQGESKNKSDKS